MSRGKGSNVADATEVGEDNIAGADNDFCDRNNEVYPLVKGSPKIAPPSNSPSVIAITASATEVKALIVMPADIQRSCSSAEWAAEMLRIRPLVMPPPANM